MDGSEFSSWFDAPPVGPTRVWERLAPGEGETLELAAAAREQAAVVNVATARWVAALAAFFADEGWNAGGDWRSRSHWVTVNCGLTTGEARRLSAVIGAVMDGAMPQVWARFEAGELSLGAVSLVAPLAQVGNEVLDEKLAMIAATCTGPQLSRVLSQFRRLATPAPDRPRSQWRSWFDDEGRWHCRGMAPGEVGALMDEAFAAASKQAEQSGDDSTDETLGEPEAPDAGDALGFLAGWALESARRGGVRDEHGEAFVVQVEIDLETFLTGELRPESVCRMASGRPLTPAMVREMAEQGSVQLLWHRDGVPLRLGREQRLASRQQRRALRFRDRGCAVPGCGQQRRLHAHHVRGFPAGPTDVENLVLLCRFHHRRIHQGGWTIWAGADGGFVFRDRAGEIVGRPPAVESPPALDLDIGIDDRTATPLGGGATLTLYGRDIYLHALLTAA